MSKILVSIIIEQTCLIHFAEIVESCKAAGLEVQREMTTVGVISGTIEASRITVLGQIRGVSHVEQARDVTCLNEPPAN